MKYLTVNSSIQVSIRNFTKQEDADGATFILQRTDDQKKVLDQASTQVKKTATFNPVTWEIRIDDEAITTALTDDEMQCNLVVSVTAVGKTWIPDGQRYTIYRNKITVSAKDEEGAAIVGARCTCVIRKPPDYYSETAAALGGKKRPNTVTTADDGAAEVQLDSPGELSLEWAEPYYPQDNAAWSALKGVKREAVLLRRERKARFIWPALSNGEEQKHFVNLAPKAGSNTGGKLRIEIGCDGGLAGDKLHLTVELTSQDTKDAAGEALKCLLENQELEVGKPKTTLTLTLDSDGSRVVELDFRGCGGITAKLTVSTVEGSTDESVSITSWRKVDVQPYHPAPRFFKDDAFPEDIAKKVKEAFDEVFIEVEFLASRLLIYGFPGVEQKRKFEIVVISDARAMAAGLDPGPRTGNTALVYFKMGDNAALSPAHWLAEFPGAHQNRPPSALHAVFAHSYYETRSDPVSLMLSKDKLASEPQTPESPMAARNMDATENPEDDLVLPWSSNKPSHWRVQGQKTQGRVTMDFIEVDPEKTKQGQYEFRVRLPDDASGDPKKLAVAGKKIMLNIRLRTHEFGVSAANIASVLYIGLVPDYASARAAYAVIHEIAHVLGFAPVKGEFFYNVSGRHCANGIKSDAEAYVQEKSGVVGATIADTLSKGLTGRNVPSELAAAGKFGTCVMWGHADRQNTTEEVAAGALKFCSACGPLMRVISIGSVIGGGT